MLQWSLVSKVCAGCIWNYSHPADYEAKIQSISPITFAVWCVFKTVVHPLWPFYQHLFLHIIYHSSYLICHIHYPHLHPYLHDSTSTMNHRRQLRIHQFIHLLHTLSSSLLIITYVSAATPPWLDASVYLPCCFQNVLDSLPPVNAIYGVIVYHSVGT